MSVIMGASGSGKSTLLYALSGMDKPTLGKVFFGDAEIQDYSNDSDTLCLAAGKLVWIFLLHFLIKPDFCKQLLYPFDKLGGVFLHGKCARQHIVKYALIFNILFADEPTGSLNSASGGDVLDIFTQVHENGQSIVMVTHENQQSLFPQRSGQMHCLSA